MDTFFRSASHNIVLAVLLLFWSGLILGVFWKILSHAWNALRRLLPGRTHPVVQVLRPQYPREHTLSEASLPLLPLPQDDLLAISTSRRLR